MPKCNALITGNYRSGTEYLSNLLNAHKNVTSEMYATNFLRYYYKALTVEDFKTSIATHLIERKNKTIPSQLLDKVRSFDDIPEFIHQLYDFLEPYCKLFVDKEQLAWRYLDFYKRVFPAGKIITLVRDPRGVMNSFRKFTFHQGDYYLTSCLNSLGLFQYLDMNKNRRDILIVTYEELIENHAVTMSKICLFLGIEEQIFDPHYKGKSIDGSEWSDNTSSISKFDYSYSKNSWKSELNPTDIFLTEDVCGSYFEKYGYRHHHFSTKQKKPNYSNFSPWVFKQFEFYLTTGQGMCKFPLE